MYICTQLYAGCLLFLDAPYNLAKYKYIIIVASSWDIGTIWLLVYKVNVIGS